MLVSIFRVLCFNYLLISGGFRVYEKGVVFKYRFQLSFDFWGNIQKDMAPQVA